MVNYPLGTQAFDMPPWTNEVIAEVSAALPRTWWNVEIFLNMDQQPILKAQEREDDPRNVRVLIPGGRKRPDAATIAAMAEVIVNPVD